MFQKVPKCGMVHGVLCVLCNSELCTWYTVVVKKHVVPGTRYTLCGLPVVVGCGAKKYEGNL